MKKRKYLRLGNVGFNAEIALLAVIHLCHVWAPRRNAQKLGKHTHNRCFTRGCFSVAWAVGLCLASNWYTLEYANSSFLTMKRQTLRNRRHFWRAHTLRKLGVFRIKTWRAEPLTWKYWSSGVSFLPRHSGYYLHLLLLIRSTQSFPTSLRTAQDKAVSPR